MMIQSWRFRLGVCFALAAALFCSYLFLQASHAEQTGDPANLVQHNPVNLALHKDVRVTSFCNSCATYGSNAVDGNYDTFWRALSWDLDPEIVVDLGEAMAWNKVVMTLNHPIIDRYSIEYSIDGEAWEEVWVLNYPPLESVEAVVIEPVEARYVKVAFSTNTPARPLVYELEIYLTDEEPTAPPSSVLVEVLLSDGDRTYEFREALSLSIGDTHQFQAAGMMSDGSEADLTRAEVSFQSSDTRIVQVDQNGHMTVVGDGVGKLRATIAIAPVSLTTEIFVVVENLQDNVIWEASWEHPTMRSEIGQPAVVHIGDPLPALKLEAYADAVLEGELLDGAGNLVLAISEALQKDEGKAIAFSGHAAVEGLYQLNVTLTPAGRETVYDALYFTVRNPAGIEAGQSQAAYLGEDGRLRYVPDYKGNTLLDFSNSGYMGGGVRIPDVQARIVVEPGDGDDTARIQAAINQVSRMPVTEDGFRGAVVLEKGTFEVGGTLRIEADGVVLRGKGSGEDGTILYATGTTRRDIVQIRGTSGPSVIASSRVEITDLYVPVGARTFRVADAGSYAVGDPIMVRRYGNDHWIHAIHMDRIVEREDTEQWSPFALNFDRVITAIDGNLITIDAPIANAIERRWGGGEIFHYTDAGRIENVGVENLRVKVEFDPSVTMMWAGEAYYADENKARTFVTLNNVKNAWVREIDAYHLEFSLAHVNTNAKWVTVQDARALEPVSIITGSRRYAFNYNGQLALTQRVYAEKSRHAFVVGSRVAGPNVFLDSVSDIDYNYSEPHHRWSVGGLYDNIASDIALMDRGWYGTGHGWAGANYVAWNTRGVLIAQSPPTAQNYAIGHVGERRPGDWPNANDPRPREDGYWESHGEHVAPGSLYVQQLTDRLGGEAVQNIARTPVGGEALDTPVLDHLPSVQAIYLNGVQLEGFDPQRHAYVYEVPAGMGDVPYVTAVSDGEVTVDQAGDFTDAALIRVFNLDYPGFIQEYVIAFTHQTPEPSPSEWDVQMNGFLQIPESVGMQGHTVSRIHIQGSWQLSEQGGLSGQGMLHTTPRGVRISLEAVDWIAGSAASGEVVLQWTGADEQGRAYTIRISHGHAESGSEVSVFIWKEQDTNAEPLAMWINQPFRGSIQIR